jgi:hypothetical protein
MSKLPRFVAGEFIEAEDHADVLVFLSRARPLDGIMYDGDERLWHGHELICRWLAACALEVVGPATKDSQLLTLAEHSYECAEVLYFLRNLEPIHARDASDKDDCDHALCGQNRLFDWIEKRLVRIAGYDDETRPHKSGGERLEEKNGTVSAEEEREAQSVLQ